MDTYTATTSRERAAAWGNAPAMVKREFLVFRVGDNHLGMDVRNVQELRHYCDLTCIVDGRRLVRQVASLYGRVMPLVDLRLSFGIAPLLYDETTDVIVAHVGGRSVCLVVDEVMDVAALLPAQMQLIPDAGGSSPECLLIGTVTWQDRQLMLIDIESFLLGPGTGTRPRMAA